MLSSHPGDNHLLDLSDIAGKEVKGTLRNSQFACDTRLQRD
jgi:hypothetical protein